MAESILDFFDERKVNEYFHELRWKFWKKECPNCQADEENITGWGEYLRKPGLRRHYCKSCDRTFNDLTGTIFDNSQISPKAWLLMMFLMCLQQSSRGISKEILVSFKSVYSRTKQIMRIALGYESKRRIFGTIEADEIYVTAGKKGKAPGGGSRNLGRDPRTRGKKNWRGRGHYRKDQPCIIAMVSRLGKAVLRVTPDFLSERVKEVFTKSVTLGSTVYTDTASSYNILSRSGYSHDSVNHSQGEYARGDVTQNRSESIFSLLKPFLIGFRGVSKLFLHTYVGFFQFLYNLRHLNSFKKAELLLIYALCPEFADKSKTNEFEQNFNYLILEEELRMLANLATH